MKIQLEFDVQSADGKTAASEPIARILRDIADRIEVAGEVSTRSPTQSIKTHTHIGNFAFEEGSVWD